eukprot:g3329.t1
MGKTKRTKKAALKKIISKNDARTKKPEVRQAVKLKEEKEQAKVKEVEQLHSSLFFSYNENLVPPYRVLVDTNFVNSALQNKTDLFKGMMDLLLAKCIPCVTDCVLAELEKMGSKYRMALSLARDPRFERLTCTHKGTYADDCLCERVHNHKCYIVGTNDADLKRRIRKIPGVPIMGCKRGQFAIERLPGHMSFVPRSGEKKGKK